MSNNSGPKLKGGPDEITGSTSRFLAGLELGTMAPEKLRSRIYPRGGRYSFLGHNASIPGSRFDRTEGLGRAFFSAEPAPPSTATPRVSSDNSRETWCSDSGMAQPARQVSLLGLAVICIIAFFCVTLSAQRPLLRRSHRRHRSRSFC